MPFHWGRDFILELVNLMYESMEVTMEFRSKFAAVAVSAAVLGGSMMSAAPAQAAGQCVDYNYSQGG